MRFEPFIDDSKTPELLKGIYPIVNVEPGIDIDDILEKTAKFPEAGIRLVQLRAKRFDEDKLSGILDDLVNDLRGSGLAVILNDYIELAEMTGADGVHLGLDDYPIFNARAMLGPNAIIGATCRNATEALMAIGQGATYIAAGSIYESPTKPGLPVISVWGLREIVEHIKEEGPPRMGWNQYDRTPVCAIGGITIEKLRDVKSAGADMVAIVGAIWNAPDAFEAARVLVEEWNKY
ncbi:MAG: thiamine phosphate synthase [bacterium]